MIIKKDKKARSISYFLHSGLANIKEIKKLIKVKSKNFTINCRFSINNNSLSTINFMIIFQKKKFLPQPKFYLKKDKIFYCIEGKQTFIFFDKKLKILKTTTLLKGDFIFVPKKTTYSNISMSKKTIHSEILSGPFTKKLNQRREYKFTKKILSSIDSELLNVR